jgi:hypothetical protein
MYTQWSQFVDRHYAKRTDWMDHAMLAMVPRAFKNVRLIVHKPRMPVVDDTPTRPKIVRIWNIGDHFMSLRKRE